MHVFVFPILLYSVFYGSENAIAVIAFSCPSYFRSILPVSMFHNLATPSDEAKKKKIISYIIRIKHRNLDINKCKKYIKIYSNY